VATPTPASVRVPKGAVSGTFTVDTQAVTAATPVILTASANGVGASATLTVNPSPGPPMIGCGQLISASIGAVAENDIYTFSAVEGDIVRLSVLTTQEVGSVFRATADVFTPSGAVLTQVYNEVKDLGRLPETGTYKLVVFDGWDRRGRGSYALGLVWICPLNRQCEVKSVTCGPNGEDGSINAIAQNRIYTFTAQKGDVVRLSVLTTKEAGSVFRATADVFTPGCALLTQVYNDVKDLGPLPEAGAYTLVVFDGWNRRGQGSYKLGLTCIRSGP
jgi:hypothetical protein